MRRDERPELPAPWWARPLRIGLPVVLVLLGGLLGYDIVFAVSPDSVVGEYGDRIMAGDRPGAIGLVCDDSGAARDATGELLDLRAEGTGADWSIRDQRAVEGRSWYVAELSVRHTDASPTVIRIDLALHSTWSGPCIEAAELTTTPPHS